MKKLLSKLQQQRGQAIILFVGLFTIITIIGVITLDVGLWFSERRGAQTDADLPALAGAAELMVLDAGPDEAAAAEAKAEEFLQLNDQSGNLRWEPIQVDDSCFSDNPRDRVGVPDSVIVDVHHDSGALFAGELGLPIPDVGAHAKACAGSLVTTTGLRPWTLSMFCSPCFDWTDDDEDGIPEADDDTFTPRFGEDCIIRTDGQTETESGAVTTCDPSKSQVGSVRLGPDDGDECSDGSGDADYRENIIEGSPALCSIGDIIDTEPGMGTGPTKQGLLALLAGEGDCDEENCDDPGGICDGIDQFQESFSPADVVPSEKVTYSPKGCTTPRVVNIVIVDGFDGTGIDHRPIQGFASLFIMQCEVVNKKDGSIKVYPKCDMGGSNFQIRGRFMKKVELGGCGGPMDPFGTHVIFLAE